MKMKLLNPEPLVIHLRKYWMHNGFVKIDDEKMSKSLGNFFTIRSVLEKYQAEVVRFFILKAHYRSPLNFSQKNLDESKQAITKLYMRHWSMQNFSLRIVMLLWNKLKITRFWLNAKRQ